MTGSACDLMIRLAERESPQIANKLRYAAFIKSSHDECTGRGDPDFYADFRMIWKACVVEDSGGAVLLERHGSDLGSVIDQSSRSSTRDMGLNVGDVFFIASAKSGNGIDALGLAYVRVDAKSYDESGSGIGWGMNLDQSIVGAWDSGSGKRIYSSSILEFYKRNADVGRSLHRSLVTDVEVAMRELMQAATPSNWIISKAPTDPRPQNSKKIPRSHQRTTYRVITDKERRRYFRESCQENAEPGMVTAHPRRAHYRCLDRGLDTQRHVWVKACWVGDKTADIRGGRYRIELDL